MYSYKNKNLHCENINLIELSKKVGSPFYCYSSKILESKYSELTDAFKEEDLLVCFSLKANSNQSIIKTFSSLGSGADVVSIGELKRALKAKIPPNKIVFSGVGKNTDEIIFAIKNKILMINVESISELKQISTQAANLNMIAPISLRVNPDIEAGGNEKISTGKKQDKFGISIKEAIDVYELASNLDNIEIKGIDVHIGSQINDLEPFEKTFNSIVETITKLKDKNIDIDIIDIGGGIGINYTDEKALNIKDYAALVSKKLGSLNKKIIIEPGRFLTAESGILVTKIIYIKENESKKFIIVDAAMNDFIRPSLYGSLHNALPIIENDKERPIESYDVVGPICETGDFFIKDFKTSQLLERDLLAITNVGAYGSVLSSNYNSRPSIAEIIIKDDSYSVIKKRQDIEEMIDQDSLADWQEN
ncbi:MAG: diaminopimelate decarboxylase [Hyphomicrobiales bacterium]|jgi:diaminopimelate decarboxylase|nr:diaminopimelate decarboxylase [Hyphomicrobiales bacterium]